MDSEQKPSGKPEEYYQNKYGWYATKLIVLVIVAVIGWYAYLTYTGEFDHEYEYPAPTAAGGFITGLPPDTPPELNISVVFNTTSLSAQNPITVEVRLWPTEDFKRYKPDPWDEHYPDHEYLVFPYALKYPLTKLEGGDYEAAAIRVNKSDNPREFYGKGQIIYPFEGRYGYLFVGQTEMNEKRQENGLTNFDAVNLTNRIHNATYFNVGSSDEVTNLRNNNIFLALTLVFVAFGVAQFHGSITAGMFLIGNGWLKLVRIIRLMISIIRQMRSRKDSLQK
ncbi:MAG: hypothetical protein AB1351_13190 [Thermoproteota archaeon]